jgi:hypothetical protein
MMKRTCPYLTDAYNTRIAELKRKIDEQKKQTPSP